MAFYVYILHSETTNRYYVGQTKHLEQRVAYPNSNYSLALRNRGPWKLVYFEQYTTRSQAVRREQYIKRQKLPHRLHHLTQIKRRNIGSTIPEFGSALGRALRMFLTPESHLRLE